MTPNRMLLLAMFACGIAGGAIAATPAYDWLSLCSKCLSPTIFATSGLGTANAVAEARITQEGVAGWCANWTPDDKSCVREQMANEDSKRVYRATANCPAGRITAVDGKTYTLAGVWVGDIGAGRAKFRDSAGKIVGRSNAENGLGISQNWEVLCPGPVRKPQAASLPSQPRPAGMPSAGMAAQFSVGQIIEAKYGSAWVRGRVNAIRAASGRNGPELAYDVSLANGKRGLVPARMLRPAR